MDSDQDSADDWELLGSRFSDDDADDRVLALSSGCATPVKATATDDDLKLALSSRCATPDKATGTDDDDDLKLTLYFGCANQVKATGTDDDLLRALSSRGCATPDSATGTDDDLKLALSSCCCATPDSATGTDGDLALALSSGCATPDSATGTDIDAYPTSGLVRAAAAAFAEDAEGVYALSDAEDDNAYAAPSPALPRPLAGLFYHTLDGSVSYAPFDPAGPADGRHGAKQLIPDPTFSALISDDILVSALASTRGLVCLRGAVTGDYYAANPLTFRRARLPRPWRDHFAAGDPAVVITFDVEDDDDEGGDEFFRHYHVVVAFPIGDGIYAFESFSSRAWGWTVGEGIAAAELVVPTSGVGALGCAFWRTTMGYFLCYEPVSGYSSLVPEPVEVAQWTRWELGEMEGKLCATCVDDRVNTVVVICLDLARRTTNGRVAWTLAGHFEGGCLRGREDVRMLRSQGKAEVVMWDNSAEMVVAMDLEGRTTRTISFLRGSAYYADFIPYVSSLVGVSPSGKGPHAVAYAAATNEAQAVYEAVAADPVAY